MPILTDLSIMDVLRCIMWKLISSFFFSLILLNTENQFRAMNEEVEDKINTTNHTSNNRTC